VLPFVRGRSVHAPERGKNEEESGFKKSREKGGHNRVRRRRRRRRLHQWMDGERKSGQR
jgi:hypothetical protein